MHGDPIAEAGSDNILASQPNMLLIEIDCIDARRRASSREPARGVSKCCSAFNDSVRGSGCCQDTQRGTVSKRIRLAMMMTSVSRRRIENILVGVQWLVH
ncbi:hypothetical protein SAMN05421890_4948 [Ensifer adhaerens]|nr:hypothetical protein SAMN05421890_4948 [Ensifer adhaerens]